MENIITGAAVILGSILVVIIGRWYIVERTWTEITALQARLSSCTTRNDFLFLHSDSIELEKSIVMTSKQTDTLCRLRQDITANIQLLS